MLPCTLPPAQLLLRPRKLVLLLCIDVKATGWEAFYHPTRATTELVGSDPSLQVLPGNKCIYFFLKLFVHLLAQRAWKTSTMYGAIFISAFVIYVLDCCRALHGRWHFKSLENTGWAECISHLLCFPVVLLWCRCSASLSWWLVLKTLALANPRVTRGYLHISTGYHSSAILAQEPK